MQESATIPAVAIFVSLAPGSSALLCPCVCVSLLSLAKGKPEVDGSASVWLVGVRSAGARRATEEAGLFLFLMPGFGIKCLLSGTRSFPF